MSDLQRTPERLRHHFEVERELASRLRTSKMDERSELLGVLYDELFERVPDHPRLARRVTEEESRRTVDGQLKILAPFLKPESTLVEFACGDARLAAAACSVARRVIGLDISDQRNATDRIPENFDHFVYDGYRLDLPDQIADVVFSYQFLEHLHPEDVNPHFELVHRLLKPGGWYLFDTPHRFTGPHDISAFFGDELVCFHFQEWTFGALADLSKKCGFGKTSIYRRGRLLEDRFSVASNRLAESIIGVMPRPLRKNLSQRLFQSVTLAVQRPRDQ